MMISLTLFVTKEFMKTPHKHAALIKAWADGAEIEYLQQRTDTWLETENPEWSQSLTYRIKPEPKPDIEHYLQVNLDGVWGASSARRFTRDNLKITYDGETGKLKAAEVL